MCPPTSLTLKLQHTELIGGGIDITHTPFYLFDLETSAYLIGGSIDITHTAICL